MFKELSLKLFAYILLTGLLSYFSASQDYKFNAYGVKEGVCHPFVYTINQDINGYIWIGTGEGLCRYDGFEFTQKPVTDLLVRDVASTSYKDSKGNLWFGFNNGTICSYDGFNFEIVTPPENIKSAITDIIEIEGNIMLVATLNDGLVVIDKNKEVKIYNDDLKNKYIYSLNYSKGNLLLGTQYGLLIYEFKDLSKPPVYKYSVKNLEYIKIQVIRKCKIREGFLLGTENE